MTILSRLSGYQHRKEVFLLYFHLEIVSIRGFDRKSEDDQTTLARLGTSSPIPTVT